jgi:hypothetical protein
MALAAHDAIDSAYNVATIEAAGMKRNVHDPV